MSAPVVEFQNVWKSYARYTPLRSGLKSFLLSRGRRQPKIEPQLVLRDLGFRVEPGECLGIVGLNGSGKSTILGMAAGVLKPSRGRIVLRQRPFPMLELGAGFHPDFTGRDNIILNGMILGRPKKFVLGKQEEIAAFAELEHAMDDPIRTYSSGMLARLGFSVLAHLEPDLLLIDEVLAVGDLSFQERCLAKFADFRSKGVTMIFVSHSMREVRRVCDRVIWIAAQGIRMQGAPSQVTAAFEDDSLHAVGGAKNSLRLARSVI